MQVEEPSSEPTEVSRLSAGLEKSPPGKKLWKAHLWPVSYPLHTTTTRAVPLAPVHPSHSVGTRIPNPPALNYTTPLSLYIQQMLIQLFGGYTEMRAAPDH